MRIHRMEIRDQGVEVVAAQELVRGHVAITELARIQDVRPDLLLWPVLDDALRHVEIRPDTPSLAVDRVAADAFVPEDAESLHRRRVVGEPRRRDVPVNRFEAAQPDRGELPGTGVGLQVELPGLPPDDVKGTRVRLLRPDGLPAGDLDVG